MLGLALLAARLRRQPDGADRIFVMLGAAVVILWLLQMDYLGVRPWRAVWAVVPGAKAVRYTFRSQLVANLLVAPGGGPCAGRHGAPARAGRCWCARFLLVEQINLAWPPTMSRRAALAWIDAVPPPPAGCRVFYVSPNAGAARPQGAAAPG